MARIQVSIYIMLPANTWALRHLRSEHYAEEVCLVPDHPPNGLFSSGEFGPGYIGEHLVDNAWRFV